MAPAGYTSGGHAMYPSYGQENDARRGQSRFGKRLRTTLIGNPSQ
jgi:hypothetical protein